MPTASYITYLQEVTSTNTYMAAHAADMTHGSVVAAHSQIAGRGQRGNTWESQPGMNVTMSMMLHPKEVSAREQFLVSEAVAAGVALTLRRYLGDDAGVCVKWPNDIYVHDRKICGILIENVLAGSSIARSIAGIGLNVNQRQFLSDAPNPVSMFQIAGREFPLDGILDSVRRDILELYERYIATADREGLHRLYTSMLWRRTGMYPYLDTATGNRFTAAIHDVALTGHITLCDTEGTLRRYAFKEVAAIL